MIILRRPKLRVRTGCDACKARRKKCDEVHPECGACRRLGLRCQYGYLSLQPRRVPQPRQEKPPLLRELGEEFSEETWTTIQFFNKHRAESGDESIRERTIIGLLPLGYNKPAVFNSIVAVCAVYMPEEWPHRRQHVLELRHQTIKNVRSALAESGSRPPEYLIIAIGMLHFLDVGTSGVPDSSWGVSLTRRQLHMPSDDATKLVHLRAVGTMLKLQLADTKLNHASSDILRGAMESYLFHTVATSSVRFGVALPVTSSAYVIGCIKLLAFIKGVHDDHLRILGIRSEIIEFMFCLARLRFEILRNDVEFATLDALRESRVQLSKRIQAAGHDLKWYDTLFVSALMRYETILATALKASEELDWIAIDREPIACGSASLALQEARTKPSLMHSFAWPLFMHGLTAETAEMEADVLYCLTKMVRDGYLESIEPIIQLLEESSPQSSQPRVAILLDEERMESIFF